jgi:transposase
MAQNFLSCDREQELLLPPSLREWLPAGHLAWFVLEVVDELDLSGFYGAYRGDGQGRPAHEPAMMTALFVYAYAVGERSTRAIERRCGEDVAFRVIAANRVPDHTTIARFRVRHEQALAGLFTDVLVLCQRAGLLRSETVAVDGTKLAANASRGANRSYASIRADAERYLRESAEVDAAEDELYGNARGDELPAELAHPGTRRAAIRRAKAELEAEHAARQAQWEAKDQRRREHREKTGKWPRGRPLSGPPQEDVLFASRRNLTDLDSRMMRDQGAKIQAYNAQAVVADGQIIIAAELTNHATDICELQPMITAAGRELARLPTPAQLQTVLADNGYWNNAQIAALEDQGLTTIVATAAAYRDTPRLRAPRQGPQADRIRALLATEDGQALYRGRQQIIEPVFGHIKYLRGIDRLARRGLTACQAEWKLIAASHNLLKLYRAPNPASA